VFRKFGYQELSCVTGSKVPITVAGLFKVRRVFDHINTGIADSNPALDLCFPVQVQCCDQPLVCLMSLSSKVSTESEQISGSNS
jgi:hypothetical protein